MTRNNIVNPSTRSNHLMAQNDWVTSKEVDFSLIRATVKRGKRVKQNGSVTVKRSVAVGGSRSCVRCCGAITVARNIPCLCDHYILPPKLKFILSPSI